MIAKRWLSIVIYPLFITVSIFQLCKIEPGQLRCGICVEAVEKIFMAEHPGKTAVSKKSCLWRASCIDIQNKTTP